MSKAEVSQRNEKKAKFTLASMLANAKKVEKVFTNPIVDKLEEEGFFTGSTVATEYIDGLDSKFKAFSRKLDLNFLKAYGRAFHEHRKLSWERVKRMNVNSEKILFPGWNDLKAMNIAFDDRYMMFHTPRNTYQAYEQKVSLPRLNYREVILDNYAEMQAESGLLPFRPDQVRDGRLDYMRKATINGPMYHEELDELKHIYKAFWFSNSCQRFWLQSLYLIEEEKDSKVHEFFFKPYKSPDGLNRDYENTIIVQLNGELFYISVEKLFHWIEWTRQEHNDPARIYAIGESPDENLLLYALWLNLLGVPEYDIKERLSSSLINDAFHEYETSLGEMMQRMTPRAPPQSQYIDPDLPDWVREIMSRPILKSFSEMDVYEKELTYYDLHEEGDVTFYPGYKGLKLHVQKVRFEDFNFEEDEAASNSTASVVSRVSSNPFGIQMPYEPETFYEHLAMEVPSNLYDNDDDSVDDDNHSPLASDVDNNETYDMGFAGEEDFTHVNPSLHGHGIDTAVDTTPQVPNALEMLGIDLVDPRNYTSTENPHLRRLRNIWLPTNDSAARFTTSDREKSVRVQKRPK
jgi:hypothetical protein